MNTQKIFPSQNLFLFFSRYHWRRAFLALLCLLSFATISISEDDTDEEMDFIAYSLTDGLEKAALYSALPDVSDSLVFYFGGITLLDGFMIDPINNDIILVGFSSGSGHPLHLDDFVEILNNAVDSTISPFCSIDPVPSEVQQVRRILEQPIKADSELQFLEAMNDRLKNIRSVWKKQNVRIGGISPLSHHAHLMVDADYRLKKATLGLITFQGVESYLERLLKPEAYGIPLTSTNFIQSVRFWFHIQSFNPIDSARVPFPHFERSELVVQLLDCPVVLLTEKQIFDVFGVAHPDSDKTDPFAEAYAADFSNQFENLKQSEPNFTALHELFKLNALVRAMDFVGAFEKVDFPIRKIQKEYRPMKRKPMPSTLPALVNHQSTFVFAKDEKGEYYNVLQYPIVYGGVDMSFPMTERQFFRRKMPLLDSLRHSVLKARKDTSEVYWKVNRK